MKTIRNWVRCWSSESGDRSTVFKQFLPVVLELLLFRTFFFEIEFSEETVLRSARRIKNRPGTTRLLFTFVSHDVCTVHQFFNNTFYSYLLPMRRVSVLFIDYYYYYFAERVVRRGCGWLKIKQNQIGVCARLWRTVNARIF